MLRILHTSDLHLGLRLYDYDRSEEQQHMLQQIADIAVERKVDALVISGDIYHTAQPSAMAGKMFVHALTELRHRMPEIKIVVTAGNHDSPSRTDTHAELWDEIGVLMVGLKKSEDSLWDAVVEIEGKGYIVAVPYIVDRNPSAEYYRNVIDIVNGRNERGLPVVVMAHTTISGADWTGHDQANERTVGGIDSLRLADFGTAYDYLALGHIHKSQTLRKAVASAADSDSPSVNEESVSNCIARYCGSPLAVNFDERYPHSVSIVEIDSHGSAPRIEKVPIEDIRPLVNIPGEGFADWESVREQLKSFPADKQAYVRINVEVDEDLPRSAVDEAASIAADKQCRMCPINSRRKVREQGGRTAGFTVAEFQAMNPLDLARMFAGDKGKSFGEDMEEMFITAQRRTEHHEN